MGEQAPHSASQDVESEKAVARLTKGKYSRIAKNLLRRDSH
jgi:hypothetical protein